MKVLLLGFDGLDYFKVQKLGCFKLMQEKFSILQVPISERYGCPSSATVWASLLTGRFTERYFEKPYQKRIGLIRTLEKVKGKLPFEVSLGLARKIKEEPPRFPVLNLPTLLDKISVSKAVNVPYVNCDCKHLALGFHLKNPVTTVKQVIEQGLTLFKTQYFRLYEQTLLSAEAKFVFGFLGFPDALAHLCLPKREELLKQVYYGLDKLTAAFNKMLPDTQIFVMSDHGFNHTTMRHSNEGFISSNTDTLPTDLYQLHETVVKIANS